MFQTLNFRSTRTNNFTLFCSGRRFYRSLWKTFPLGPACNACFIQQAKKLGFLSRRFALVRQMMQLRQTQPSADAREYRAKLALCFQPVLLTASGFTEPAG